MIFFCTRIAQMGRRLSEGSEGWTGCGLENRTGLRNFSTFYTHYIIYRHIGDTILCIDFTLIIQHDGGRNVVLFCRAWVNYTFLLFICLYNYTFSLFSCLQNYTFLYFDYLQNYTFSLFSCLQNYTFLCFDYSGNYTFSLFLSFEVFCRLITEVEEWRN